MATSFSGGRSRSTRRESPIMDKQLVNFITCVSESSAPFFLAHLAFRPCELLPSLFVRRLSPISITKTLHVVIVPTKNERDPPLFTGMLLIKFQNILRNTTQVIIRHRVKILFSVISSPITLLVGTISNVLVMEIGWTDVGCGGYMLVSKAHSNAS
jgi:hypothetical protein